MPKYLVSVEESDMPAKPDRIGRPGKWIYLICAFISIVLLCLCLYEDNSDYELQTIKKMIYYSSHIASSHDNAIINANLNNIEAEYKASEDIRSEEWRMNKNDFKKFFTIILSLGTYIAGFASYFERR